MTERLNPSLDIRFQDFEEAAVRVLQIMAEFIHVNTLFIARNDGKTNRMVKVLNKSEKLVKEGDERPFPEAYCSLSVEHGEQVLVIPDLKQHKETKNMDVTEKLGGGTFIAIPINYKDGKNYGTICGLDTEKQTFTEKQMKMFETMSALLSYVLELDYTNKQLFTISAPVVKVAKGIAILPVVGDIDEQRAESIIEKALFKSRELELERLIVDLSGILHINHTVVASLLKISTVLKLVGVDCTVTGLRPDLAMKAVQMNADLKEMVFEKDLEKALQKIGFKLK
ncbi:GAF domain-containing protein [Domibacillus indicus]|uniref:STAS domain-containing protein n=1 Tax=Domibacillus indicus TaxID=1437523 RepID=UPI00203C6E46|nr:STAS domain-containing protein [Domibacillus indicus]MCM3789897.1 GAF domain-containing protein [Domibacillus indicus]